MVHGHHHRSVHPGLVHTSHRLITGHVRGLGHAGVEVGGIRLGWFVPANLTGPRCVHTGAEVHRVPVVAPDVHVAVHHLRLRHAVHPPSRIRFCPVI